MGSISEFDGESVTSRPANGKTGECINHLLNGFLRDYISDNLDEGIYEVGLINSIQYQCSLGESPKIYRDKLFLYHWINGGNEEFKNRIERYSPNLLINSCTKGSSVESGSESYITKELWIL